MNIQRDYRTGVSGTAALSRFAGTLQYQHSAGEHEYLPECHSGSKIFTGAAL